MPHNRKDNFTFLNHSSQRSCWTILQINNKKT